MATAKIVSGTATSAVLPAVLQSISWDTVNGNLLPVLVTTTAGIAVNTQSVILSLDVKIRDVISMHVTSLVGTNHVLVPRSATLAAGTHFEIKNNGYDLEVGVLAAGVAIPAGSIIRLLLVTD